MSEFKDRLKQARKNAKMTQVELAKAVNTTQGSISDLESGRNKSTTNLIEIAGALGVNPTWLATGQGEMTTHPSLEELKLKAEAIKTNDTKSNILSMARPVPVLSWVAAGSWSENNTVTLDDANDWLPRPLGLSEQGFALIVRGESMLPDFRPDDYIYVEPNVLAISLKNGDLVVVQKADGSQAEATFKQLIIGETSDDMYLKPLNPNWHEQKMLPMTEDEWVLVGKVVGRYTKF